MSSTIDQLTQDMKTAMKEKDKERLSTIRMIRAVLKNAQIEQGDLSEEAITELLAKEAKQRREAAKMYRDGGSPELAEKEEKELEVIQTYLPKQLTDDEVMAIIEQVIAETGAASKSDLGKVMGPVVAKTKGRFPGGKIKDLVMAKLS